MKRTRAAVAAVAASLCLWPAANAQAQDTEVILKPRSRVYESPQNFALELRLSPYRPQIDDEPNLNGTPYRDTFGTMPRVLVAVELDWQLLRIPYLGTLGPGVAVGYTSMTERARQLDSDEPSGDNTNLEVFPMYAVAVLRADALMRHVGVPLVPYVKGGIGYVPWRTFTSGGGILRGHPRGASTGRDRRSASMAPRARVPDGRPRHPRQEPR